MRHTKTAALSAMVAAGIIAGGCAKDYLASIARTLDRIEKELAELESRNDGRDSSASTGADSLAQADSTGPGGQDGPPAPPPVKYILYASGVRYEDGFNWKLEQEGSDTRATLFLMKDGESLVEIPTGFGAEAGTQADMHRILDGHLYSDSASDRYTFLLRDGVRTAQWEGREMIYDILLPESGGAEGQSSGGAEGDPSGRMLILSGPRSAEGFSLRSQDEVLVHENALIPVSGFYRDGNDICFNARDAAGTAIFVIPEDPAAGTGQIRVSRLDLPAGNQIAALRRGGHTLTLLKGRKDADSGVYLDEDPLFHIQGGFSRGEIFAIAEETYILVTEESVSRVYDAKGNIGMTVMGCRGVGCLPIGGEPRLLYTGQTDTHPSLYPGDLLSSVPEDCGLSIPYAYTVAGSHLALALETADGKPAIWYDGKLLEYDFNGLFTHLALAREE